MNCPICEEELDFLDTIVKKSTGNVEYYLYICHNSECSGENIIYNDRMGYPQEGDLSGLY